MKVLKLSKYLFFVPWGIDGDDLYYFLKIMDLN